MSRKLGFGVLVVVVLCALATGAVVAQDDGQRGEQWNQTYGDASAGEGAAIANAPGGGYVIAGYARHGDDDVSVVRVNSDGTRSWRVTYGGPGDDHARDVVPTNHGSVVVAGWKTDGGDSDAYLLQIGPDGRKRWEQTYGTSANERAVSLVRTDDGGYALAGWTQDTASGYRDAWVVKVAADGTKQWSRTYGKSVSDRAQSLVQTDDGGFAFAGWTNSTGSGGDDAWLVRLDGSGALQWERTYGGEADDGAYGHGLVQTADGGFALGGWTDSFGAGQDDMWLVRVGTDGTKQWSETYGQSLNDVATGLVRTANGGFAISGYTQTTDNGYNGWLVTTGPDGATRWQDSLGGSSTDATMDLTTTADGGYALAGYTGSFGAGSYDTWLVKAADTLGPEPPTIHDTSFDIGPYPVETGVPPVVLVRVSNADEVTLETTVNGETDTLSMTNVSGNDLWKGDLAEIDDPDLAALGPGERVGLEIRATNEGSSEVAVLNQTEDAYPRTQLPTRSEIPQSRLHYYTFAEVTEVQVILAKFAGQSLSDFEALNVADPSNVSEWQQAREYDVNSYYGSGALGFIGFDFKYVHGEGGPYVTVGERSEYDRKSFIEAAKNSAPTDISGPYLATVPNANIGGAVTYPNMRGAYANMSAQPDASRRTHHYGVWSHELGHLVVGVNDLYSETNCESHWSVEVCTVETVEGGIGGTGLMGSRLSSGFPRSTLPDELSVLSLTPIHSIEGVSPPRWPWLEIDTTTASVGTTETISIEARSAKELGDTVPVFDPGVSTPNGAVQYVFEGDHDSRGPYVEVFKIAKATQYETGLNEAVHLADLDVNPETSFKEDSVDEKISPHSPLWATIEVVSNNGQSGEQYEADVRVGLEAGDPNTKTMTMSPQVSVDSSSSEAAGAASTTTDVDLNLVAVDSQGRRVGETESGEYVVEIPGANASGDTDGMEWISVPDDVDVQFYVRSENVDAFLNATGLERADVNVTATTSITHTGSNPKVTETSDGPTVTNTTTEVTTQEVEDDSSTSVLETDVLAGFGVSVDEPTPNQTITFDASVSTGLNTTVDSYRWDLDADGQTEKTGRRVQTAFSTTGTYEVTLTVEGTDGSTDTEETNVTIVPRGPPALPEAVGSPTDTDGDGAYEDVNGDDSSNILDVQFLFANLDASTVTDNPSSFDYNGDGDVNILDIQALFAQEA